VFDLHDDWVWDFWTIRDDATPARHHLFFLHAPRTLGHPDLRHLNARVGHAVSTDLRGWTRLPDALSPQTPPAFDDLATWTGSAVRGPDGRWWLFTSGLSSQDGGLAQRFGAATSTDLHTWTRTDLVSEADPRWYAVRDYRGETHWRDPFVVAGPEGWHLYLTAKASPESWPEPRGNGVVGHLTSPDLRTWTIHPPLGGPTGRFDQLEVISLAEVDGRWALLFSCLGREVVGGAEGAGGVWSVPVDGPGAPVDLDRAVRLTSEDLYVGRVVDTDEGPRFLAFENRGAQGGFTGGVVDPVPIAWRTDGAGLELAADAAIPARWRPPLSNSGAGD
jgi:beta-fructofuranosidase